jgi:hypothetical protein
LLWKELFLIQHDLVEFRAVEHVRNERRASSSETNHSAFSGVVASSSRFTRANCLLLSALIHWPVPVKPITICNPIPWLMTSWPVRVPVAVGAKTTATEQLVFAAKALPHVLVWLKSPLAVMLLIKLADVPVALSVTVCGELTVPTL